MTNLTAFLTLSVTAVLYLRMEWIQNFVRAWWQREYEQKVASTDAALARADLTATKRRQLQRYRDQLPDRYHLVTSRDETYKPINFMGYVLKFGAYAFKQ
ncbi:hypothetical protein [Pseudomonas saponiphila]|uniref:hypothetical protein n=1 Tax=Pseudomonas saponiphila TaxID=556534 RepID=UPI002240ADBB|nr:hypothetical protein [Pseudomonas saponiphila]